MKHTSENHGTSEQVVKDIRRATRKQYSAEEKIRIVLDGLAKTWFRVRLSFRRYFDRM